MAESLREADIISRNSVAQKVVPPCRGESATRFEPIAGIAIPHVGSSSLTPPARNLHWWFCNAENGKIAASQDRLPHGMLSGSIPFWIFKCSSWSFSSHKHAISFWGSFITLQYQPAPYIKTRWGPPEHMSHMSLDHHPREVIKT